jgi:hypothetical protein
VISITPPADDLGFFLQITFIAKLLHRTQAHVTKPTIVSTTSATDPRSEQTWINSQRRNDKLQPQVTIHFSTDKYVTSAANEMIERMGRINMAVPLERIGSLRKL